MPVKLLVMYNINMLPEFYRVSEGFSTLITSSFLASIMSHCMAEKEMSSIRMLVIYLINVYSQFHFTKPWESLGTSLKVAFKRTILGITPVVLGNVGPECPLVSQHLATYVTGNLCLRTIRFLLSLIFPLPIHPALFSVIYKVLDITAKENRIFADRTVGSLFAWMTFQDMLCNILRKVSVLRAQVTMIDVVAMLVFHVHS